MHDSSLPAGGGCVARRRANRSDGLKFEGLLFISKLYTIRAQKSSTHQNVTQKGEHQNHNNHDNNDHHDNLSLSMTN